MNSVDVATAFEFVIGTLRGDERRQFDRHLQRDPVLQDDVQFWEQQLLTLNRDYPEVEPPAETWAAIQRRIKQDRFEKGADKRSNRPKLAWLLPLFATLLLVIAGTIFWLQPPAGINADYIAVLTNAEGAARLTAITERGGESLWLQWEDTDIPEEASLQLWAVSERDGQSRSLAIFENGMPVNVSLDETNLRLIRDASHLVLTEEELGGSAIDEPSDTVVARGECVRLQNSS